MRRRVKLSKCGSEHNNFDICQLWLVLWTIEKMIKFACENGEE